MLLSYMTMLHKLPLARDRSQLADYGTKTSQPDLLVPQERW